MDGLWIILGIVLVIIALIVLDKIINSGYKKELINKLEKEWGKENCEKYTEEEFEIIKYYYEHICKKTDIDDITWNDLDMDSIFSRINTTNSSIGSEYLYSMLHRLEFEDKCDIDKKFEDEDNIDKKPEIYNSEYKKDHNIRFGLEDRDSLACLFANNKDCRLNVQLILSKIGKNKKISIYEYMTRMSEISSNKCFINKLQVLLLLISILGIVLNYMPAIFLTFIMIGVNVASYYYHRAKIAPYLSFFAYIVRLNKNMTDLCKIDEEKLRPYQDRLQDISKSLKKLRKGAFLLTQGAVSGSFVDAIMDYVKMIFHVDIIKFYSMVEVIKDNQDCITELYEIIGFIDSSMAIASYRESLDYWSIPQLYKSEHIEYTVEEVYHPLIKEPVTNSISEKSSVLLTGSNASGKSTFIKTLAINAILSQTIYTSVSKKYVAPYYQIYTSMALRDSLFSGESYYMVEIKSLKRIITAKHKDRPILCFVDEVLRGTNTLERIAASSHILSYIAKENAMCFAATHDIELTNILENNFKNYHFQEKILDNDVKFDYKLYEGKATSRNAIQLLKMIGYDNEIVDRASHMAETFLQKGIWEIKQPNKTIQ